MHYANFIFERVAKVYQREMVPFGYDGFDMLAPCRKQNHWKKSASGMTIFGTSYFLMAGYLKNILNPNFKM